MCTPSCMPALTANAQPISRRGSGRNCCRQKANTLINAVSITTLSEVAASSCTSHAGNNTCSTGTSTIPPPQPKQRGKQTGQRPAQAE